MSAFRLFVVQLHRKPTTMKVDIVGLAGLSSLNRITVQISQHRKLHRIRNQALPLYSVHRRSGACFRHGHGTVGRISMVMFQLYLSAYLHESASKIPPLHHSQRAHKTAGLMDTQPLDRNDALEIGIRKKKSGNLRIDE